MTPKPESETDPWKPILSRRKLIEATSGVPAVFDYCEEVDAARAAEAAQHQQELIDARRAEHTVWKGRAEAAEARLAAVEEERDAFKAENGEVRRLAVKERAELAAFADRAEAERDRLKAALQDVVYTIAGWRTGSIGSIGNVHVGSFDVEHLARLRAALTPQGQSTDGETR